jgi:hypothetical protein
MPRRMMKLRIANRKIRRRRSGAANKGRLPRRDRPYPPAGTVSRHRVGLGFNSASDLAADLLQTQRSANADALNDCRSLRPAASCRVGARFTHNQKIPKSLARRPSPSRFAGPSLSPRAGRGAEVRVFLRCRRIHLLPAWCRSSIKVRMTSRHNAKYYLLTGFGDPGRSSLR